MVFVRVKLFSTRKSTKYIWKLSSLDLVSVGAATAEQGWITSVPVFRRRRRRWTVHHVLLLLRLLVCNAARLCGPDEGVAGGREADVGNGDGRDLGCRGIRGRNGG